MTVVQIPPHPWWDPDMRPDRGGDGYAALVGRTRELTDLVSSVDAAETEMAAIAAEIDAVNERLRKFVVPGDHQIAGTRMDLPGRGHPGVVPYRPTLWTTDRMTALVRFGRTHLGDRAAVHGGTLSLLFDEVLGRFANHGRQGARTATMRVNYRKVVPLDRDLQVEARLNGQEGRKLTVTGRLTDGEVTLADAEALFIALLEGQP